ncbi:hypothetical protein Taro_005427, partial [Colocasia esculenta]|nr:hypothetical protein [Colocasia esculenta]
VFRRSTRLEDSLDVRERFPDSGVQRDSPQSPELGGFGGFLAPAEESFSDFLFPLLIFPEAKKYENLYHMASHGRRGGVFAREGEQRREEQAEQQAPPPQGPVLPPPPPVDYGVFMQGLVQAMQTQAHTQAALQAQLEAQAQVPVPQAQDYGGPSIMERFKMMLPPSFKRESDPLLAE